MTMDIDEMVFTTQARITVRAADQVLLDLARKRAPDPSVFEKCPPFFWLSEISSDRLDAYFTIMDPDTTLVNYARDAAEGVAVLIGHNATGLPVGTSLTGTLERTGDIVRVLSDAYALQEAATEPIINRIKAGIARDISVGFLGRRKGAKCACSICDRDMWRDWDCWHIPGFEYEVDADESSAGAIGAKVMKLCTGRIINASLSEYSLVYDGATPGAAVIQAQRAAEAGKITTQQTKLIEQRYRIRLPDRQLSVSGYAKEIIMTEKDKTEVTAPIDVRRMQDALKRAGAPDSQLVVDGVDWLAAELLRLKPLAADGELYRKDLVDSGVVEATRAFGAEFGEKCRATLEAGSLELVKQMTEAWRSIGDAKLPGGRQTTEQAPTEEWQPAKPELPSSLYSG